MTQHLYKFILFAIVVLSSCTQDQENNATPTEEKQSKIFEQLSPDQSGITFANNLKEDSIINYFTYPYIYMGGGVAIGDVNSDGLQDIYLTANMSDNKLYLNKGGLS